MKRAGRILLLLTILSFALELFVLPVKANENTEEAVVTELNQIMTILVDCDAKELPKRGAASVKSYSAGSPVWVIGETQDGWYRVSYQEQKGYIPKDYISELQVEEEKGMVDLIEAGLDEEIRSAEAESKMIIEEIERQRGEKRRSLMWTIVIILLIIGIFVIGIFSTINFRKEKKEKKSDTESAGKKKGDDIEIVDLNWDLDFDEEEEHETDYSDSLL